jgi:hypothetical protein
LTSTPGIGRPIEPAFGTGLARAEVTSRLERGGAADRDPYRRQALAEVGQQRPGNVHLRHGDHDADLVPGDEPQGVGRVETLGEHAAGAVPGDRAQAGVEPQRVEERQRQQHHVAAVHDRR